ncbi:MAG: molybdopterin-dependent oxidoreductase, partial [Candidatus Rokubacteria bacterium]|nr:molybdopterin-dependent oxidoreductase [Candidatus Rokubacteria bacterium]
ERILPYVVPPENLVPGVASWYATVCRECPAGCGLLMRVREGRVVKVEGNPDHPVNRGRLCVRGQASLQGLYDPDRIRRPLRRDPSGALTEIGWDEAEKLLVEKLAELRREGQARRIALVSQLETGSLARLMDLWVEALGARPRISYETFAYEALRAANRLTFGVDAIPAYAFEEARVALSLGADYLETWLSPVGYAAGFARMHAVREGKPGRVIHVEPRLSLTAANADEWIANIPGSEAALALGILRVVLDERLHPTLPGRELEALQTVAKAVSVESAARASGVTAAKIRQLARAVAEAQPSLVVGGGVAVTARNATETQVAINLLNYALGNLGRTVRFGPNSAFGKVSPYGELLALTRAMERGEVGVLLLARVNPVFTTPAQAGFEAALAKVPFVVSFASHLDESAARAHLVLPDLTPLESWGDYAPQEGIHGLMQPGMFPPPGFEPRALGDLLLSVGRALIPGSETLPGPFRWPSFQAYLREAWQALGRGAAPGVAPEAFWEESLRRGGFWRPVSPTPVRLRVEALQPVVMTAPTLSGPPDGLALLVVPSSRHYDGRGANKPWLHEAPDPMTQIVWDAWAEVPVETARRLAIKEGDLVQLSSPHGALELPAHLSETLHPGAVAVPTGLGHSEHGRYAKGVGASPMRLLPAQADPTSQGLPWLSVRVTLTRRRVRLPLATLAGVTEVDPRREIIETVDLKTFFEREQKGEAPHRAHPSLYPDVQYPEHRWGMAIDLDTCIGCQACVVACQAENNVPVVGRAEAAYGRNLHWLRVERWWDRGHGPQPHAPQARFLPMLCQHCGQAPCEPVCPVFAAYHTDEGLNAQVYNRCVGTRYCGNNCPYMVRRFNWHEYSGPPPSEILGPLRRPYLGVPESFHLQLNPDVTVRGKGVMEKCTFCVQRIAAGKDRAKDEGRPVRDGEIVPACQQTCPTQAIVFGDLKDPESRVAKLSHSPRGYHVLGELGTRPAITYLMKVTRPETA